MKVGYAELRTMKLDEEAVYPVSYTHLDVYKRQFRRPEKKDCSCQRFAVHSRFTCAGPVSYTHLEMATTIKSSSLVYVLGVPEMLRLAQ